MDIVIYTNPHTLWEKSQKGYICYWTMSRFPKDLKVEDRIYFAIRGEIKGSFICDEINPGEEETIVWTSSSWAPLDTIKEEYFIKAFRGFRYRWFKRE